MNRILNDEEKQLLLDIADIVALMTGLTQEQVLAECRLRAERARQRQIAKNARFEAGLLRITDQQALRIGQMESRGYKFNKMWQDRTTQNVAVLLVNDNIWNSEKGRIGTKLMMVYPDGKTTETMEKTISIRKTF